MDIKEIYRELIKSVLPDGLVVDNQPETSEIDTYYFCITRNKKVVCWILFCPNLVRISVQNQINSWTHTELQVSDPEFQIRLKEIFEKGMRN